jgi:hypothetical protein
MRAEKSNVAMPALQQMPGQRSADVAMGEADRHVDRLAGQLPHLDHRYVGSEQEPTRRPTVLQPGQDDRRRCPGQGRSH